MSNKNITTIVEQLAELFISTNKKLAVAESCTGGWIAKVLTDLAGSSVWFDRGFVTYSNHAKHEMLGVANKTLENHGAVSEEVVEAMALGALTHSDADYSLSVSGIAGPGGSSVDKPIGLVWFAWCGKEAKDKEKVISSEQKIFLGDRNAVREQAVLYALTGLLENI